MFHGGGCPRPGRLRAFVVGVGAVLLGSWEVHGTSLRSGTRASVPAAAGIAKLVGDIRESVGRAGEDEETVFATLYSYGEGLGTGLEHEVSGLHETLKKLEKLQAPKAASPPAHIFAAIRRLLTANRHLEGEYPDVYAAFVISATPQEQSAHRVHMTPILLGHTLALLQKIEGKHSPKFEALMQLASQRQRTKGQAVLAKARAEAQVGLQAEKDEKAEELVFSMRFSNAVLDLDERFLATIQDHMRVNSELIADIRDSRDEQLRILQDLTGVLQDGAPAAAATASRPAPVAPRQEEEVPLAPEAEDEEGGDASSAPALFLQVAASASRPALAGLQTEIETALKHKADTHSILMRIKGMLDHRAPVEAEDVQSASEGMHKVLESAEKEQANVDEVRRGCASQQTQAGEQEQLLRTNLALMTASRSHTEAAIKAAHANIVNIDKKAASLNTSSHDMVGATQQAIKSLTAQSRDRKTIMLAVRKAGEIVAASALGHTSAVDLMKSLLQEVNLQEAKERAYRTQQNTFEQAFQDYTERYVRLLMERRSHYESALGFLELHSSELAGDVEQQQQILGKGQELLTESGDLCDTIMQVYENNNQRRSHLIASLKQAIPQMPQLMGGVGKADASDDSEQMA